MTTRRVLPYGPSGWLVELTGADVVGVAAAVNRAADPDVADVVPAARTVLVRLADPADAAARQRIGDWLERLEPDAADVAPPGDPIEVRVVYDGPDLDAVAEATGLSAEDVVARHSAPTYRCAFCGFAPGFAYLSGLDERLVLPRRATPRTRVPAGSVAIASTYTAVYPSASPGGWLLLGHTSATMWDVGRRPPATIVPGAAVRFVAVGP